MYGAYVGQNRIYMYIATCKFSRLADEQPHLISFLSKTFCLPAKNQLIPYSTSTCTRPIDILVCFSMGFLKSVEIIVSLGEITGLLQAKAINENLMEMHAHTTRVSQSQFPSDWPQPQSGNVTEYPRN